MLNDQLRTAEKVWSSSLEVERGAAKRSQTWTGTLVRPKQWKGVVRFGTWNVRHLYRSRLLTPPARELMRYRLVSVGVQEVRLR